MALTKAERNAVLEALLKGGLKATDVKLRARRTATGQLESGLRMLPSYVVTHEPTGSEFLFTGPNRGGWAGSMRPGTDPVTLWKALNWEKMLSTVEKWATEVAAWARMPDLWTLGTATLPDAPDNSYFTRPEQQEIARRLDEIMRYVRYQLEPPEGPLAAIAQTVEELKKASARVGRKDWKLMFYGAFITLGLEHAMQPGVVEVIFRLGVDALGHLFGAGGPPMITA